MRIDKLYILFCIITLPLFCVAENNDKRVALIIGNKDYSGTGYNTLSNPVNDAKGMAETLQKMGFTISGGEPLLNANQDQMIDAISQFRYDCREANIALFYFSGHGVTYGQDNFLLPVGRMIEDGFYGSRCVSLNTVQYKMKESRSRLNIIILDACRSALREGEKGGKDENNGLMRPENVPEGFLYCFATSKGEEAIDRPKATYSYYTEALIENMQIKDMCFGDMYDRVKIQVLNATKRRQKPTINNEDIESNNLNFYLSSQVNHTPTNDQPNSTITDSIAIRVDSTSMEVKRNNPAISRVVLDNGVLKRVPNDYEGEFIIGNDITAIGDTAFKNCSGLTTITIPNTVKKIGFAAFWGCSGLSEVVIPEGITSIDAYTFDGCKNLTRVIIPNSVISIERGAFGYCSSLVDVEIPNSVERISTSSNPFYCCNSISRPLYNNTIFVYLPRSYKGSFTLPKGIKTVVERAFDGCTDLTDVILPNSVTDVGDNAFRGCSKLKAIYVPTGAKETIRKQLPDNLKHLVKEQ